MTLEEVRVNVRDTTVIDKDESFTRNYLDSFFNSGSTKSRALALKSVYNGRPQSNPEKKQQLLKM